MKIKHFAILGIRQNIIRQFLLWVISPKFSPSKILYRTVIKTHDSESRGQEEAAIIRETKITRPLSELFTRKTAKKIANALAKLP